MKSSGFRQLGNKYTADVYYLITSTNAAGTQVNNYALYLTGVKFDAVSTGGAYGKMTAYFGNEGRYFQSGYRLHGFSLPASPGFDVGPELAYGAIWQIDTIAPAVDVFGRIDGYKARLSIVASTGQVPPGAPAAGSTTGGTINGATDVTNTSQDRFINVTY